MRLLIGTYRQREHIESCLKSIDTLVKGVDDIVFIDDSGNSEHSRWLRQYGSVYEVGGRGYTSAMQVACQAFGSDDFAAWWEEDFVTTGSVDLNRLADMLAERPHLAEIALLRQPWFNFECEAGGLIEGLQSIGHNVVFNNGVWEQNAIFTTNPSVWRKDVWDRGWPVVNGSEAGKTAQLVQAGYKFGWAPGIVVHHEGRRVGHGY